MGMIGSTPAPSTSLLSTALGIAATPLTTTIVVVDQVTRNELFDEKGSVGSHSVLKVEEKGGDDLATSPVISSLMCATSAIVRGDGSNRKRKLSDLTSSDGSPEVQASKISKSCDGVLKDDSPPSNKNSHNSSSTTDDSTSSEGQQKKLGEGEDEETTK